MSYFGKRIDGPGGRRTAVRSPALKPAGVMTVGGSQTGYLIDVSATGAKLDGAGDLSVEQDVWLKIGKIDILATVVWSEPNCCGVHFNAPLDKDEVAQLSEVPQGAMYARLSPEEKLGAADWLNGLIR
jgi:hypothetical protein